MRAFVKRVWKAAPVATVLLALALVVGLFFAVRMTAQWVYWSDPAHRDQTVATWMTPGYIANSWHVPREVVIDAVHAERQPGRPRNLAQLAAEQGRPVTELIQEAEAAIAAFRAGTLRPPGDRHAPPPEPGTSTEPRP